MNMRATALCHNMFSACLALSSATSITISLGKALKLPKSLQRTIRVARSRFVASASQEPTIAAPAQYVNAEIITGDIAYDDNLATAAMTPPTKKIPF